MFMTPSYSVPFDPRNAESESSDDSDDEDTRAPAKSVDLTLTALNSLHTLNESPDQSTFATHGVDRDRLSSLSKHPLCFGHCKFRKDLLGGLGALKDPMYSMSINMRCLECH